MYKIHFTFYKNYADGNFVASDRSKAIATGKLYAKQFDVKTVDVIDMRTGEVIFCRLNSGEIYEAAC